MLQLQHIGPASLLGTEQLGLGTSGQGQAPGGVLAPDRRFLAACRQLLQTELADRFEHQVARFAVERGIGAEQRGVDEGRDRLEGDG